MAYSDNNYARLFSSQENTTSLNEGSRDREGCTDPVILLKVQQKLLIYTILYPPKRFIEIVESNVGADVKGKPMQMVESSTYL